MNICIVSASSGLQFLRHWMNAGETTIGFALFFCDTTENTQLWSITYPGLCRKYYGSFATAYKLMITDDKLI